MAARSNLATAEPPRHHPPRAPTSPLVGGIGGALAGLMTGDPIGAFVGRGIRFISLGRSSAQYQEVRP